MDVSAAPSVRALERLLVPVLLAAASGCDWDYPPAKTFRCGAAPPFGFEVHDEHDVGYGQRFMYTRGQTWMSVDKDCKASVWQGNGKFAELSRPLAQRQLTADEYGDLRQRMGVDEWDAHADAEFSVEDEDAFLGYGYRFLSGHRVVECSLCAPWLSGTFQDLDLVVEDLYVEAAPVGDGFPLHAGAEHLYWKTDPGARWLVPWELDLGPEAFELSEYAGTDGARATAEQAVWLRSVRQAFHAADRGRSTQSAPIVEYEGSYYELHMRDW